MAKIRLKIKSHPPLTKQKLTLTFPYSLIRPTPPPSSLHPTPIGSLIPNLRVRCLPQAQKVLQMTLEMTLLNNQTVYIYIVPFIATFNSWVFHSL